METAKTKHLITGSSGQLAREFIETLKREAMPFCAPAETEFDITDCDNAAQWLRDQKPDVVLNCAAYNNVDKAEIEKEAAFAVNHLAVKNLAELCRETGAVLVHFSSDYVFDGNKREPYVEEDQTRPLNNYGRSKLAGEEAVREAAGEHLIFRLSWVTGPGQQNFLYKLEQWAKTKKELNIVNDEISVPTFTRDIVTAVLKALKRDLRGLFHLTNTGYCSRFELAEAYVNLRKLDVALNPVGHEHFPSPVKRPLFSAMSNRKIRAAIQEAIPHWKDALERYVVGVNDGPA